MSEQALRASLLRLQRGHPVPASHFTAAQRVALDRFARQTGAVSCRRQGRGDVYCVCDQTLFRTHLIGLSPQIEHDAADQLPLRAQHIAHARSSKARDHHHSCYHPILKAVGDPVIWQNGGGGTALELGALTRDFGAATLRIEADDAWHTEQALWLIENQALFDRADWLPAGTSATLLYYGGQLDGRLLSWLAERPRSPRVVLFPDYDGVGLANFARLHAMLGGACECWLMPAWESKLARYGSNPLWRATLDHFRTAEGRLPRSLDVLVDRLRSSGLALEQEAVWLPAPPPGQA